MIVARIEGFTRVLGKSQGYIGLPIKDTILGVDGGEFPVMISAWEPTPEDLRALNEGGKIYLAVFGTSHPPVLMSTKEIDK